MNPAGLWTLASSNGVRIDITAPSLTEVDGSLLQDVDVQTNVNLTVIDARWPVAGGVFEFYWKVGRIRHGDDVQPLTAVGTFVHVVLEVDPPLIVGAVYVTVGAHTRPHTPLLGQLTLASPLCAGTTSMCTRAAPRGSSCMPTARCWRTTRRR